MGDSTKVEYLIILDFIIGLIPSDYEAVWEEICCFLAFSC